MTFRNPVETASNLKPDETVISYNIIPPQYSCTIAGHGPGREALQDNKNWKPNMDGGKPKRYHLSKW
jgi:hypothetical protein